MNTQLTAMPAAQLRNLLGAALSWVRLIEPKFQSRELNRTGTRDASIFIWVICLVSALMFGGAAFAFDSPIVAIVFSLMAVGSILSAIIFSSRSREKSIANKQQIDDEIAELLQEATVLHLLPVDYCSSLALEYMIDLLDKGRASTWRECADKYEEQVHRWTVEANSAEAVRYAASAARSASWAAIGAWWR